LAHTPETDTHAQNAHACCSGKPASECCKSKPQGGGECCQEHSAAEPVKVEDFLAMDPMMLTVRLRRGIECIDRRVFDLTEEQIDAAFLPEAGVGTWPVRVLIGHLADADLSYIQRMRRAVGEENPVLEVWDENAFIDANIYGNATKEYAKEPEADHARVMGAIGGPLAVVHTLRQWAGQWLMNLAPETWNRKTLHPERGVLTLKQLVAYDTWHLEHHARFLDKKLEKMLGPAPAEEAGGCGSGCGCRH
jgi:uncharacterized damage-inducible protein DinB